MRGLKTGSLALSLLSLVALGVAQVGGAELLSQPPAEGERLDVSEADMLRWDVLRLEYENLGLLQYRIQRELKDREDLLARERSKTDSEWRARYGVGIDEAKRDAGGFVRERAAEAGR